MTEESPRTVLVVEDDETARSAIAARLRQRGMNVVTAGTGAEALHKLQHEQPALLLFDLSLPDRDAFDVLAQIRQAPATTGTPIVLMHSPLTFAEWSRVHHLNLDCLLVKPFRLGEMERVVCRVFMAMRQQSC